MSEYRSNTRRRALLRRKERGKRRKRRRGDGRVEKQRAKREKAEMRLGRRLTKVNWFAMVC